jgi:hypothetical protein
LDGQDDDVELAFDIFFLTSVTEEVRKSLAQEAEISCLPQTLTHVCVVISTSWICRSLRGLENQPSSSRIAIVVCVGHLWSRLSPSSTKGRGGAIVANNRKSVWSRRRVVSGQIDKA